PYLTLLTRVVATGSAADGVALDDHSIGAERSKARAAKSLAFLYTIDRTVIDGKIVRFPTATARLAVGQRVQQLLVSMYTRSRLAVSAPLGGYDRDINTSEELQQYATAYDTLLGAGYDLGADRATVQANLTALTGELYTNYIDPDSAGGATRLHTNNHRAKAAAAIATAAIALAEPSTRHGQVATWLAWGLEELDLVMRFTHMTGDGAYSEGPFYLRYASQNVLPFARAWDRLARGGTTLARGVEVPSFWRSPTLARSSRWMLDMTLPDGSLAPIDDSNIGRAHYFGLLPQNLPDTAAYHWAWQTGNLNSAREGTFPYETDSSVALEPDALVSYDDHIRSAPPTGSPTQFYVEGGDAIFRSDWSRQAVMAVVLGEHGTASEFGRDREGKGVYPDSHEHADPGSFLLHAYGERLALDPGYLDFTRRAMVNKPSDHNLVLVDGQGPIDYLSASFAWATNPFGPAPVDGQAKITNTADTDFIDAATVTSRYGQPAARSASVARRFLFVDNTYLFVADTVAGASAPPSTYTWLLHGNGGGTSGGTYAGTPTGGRWTQGGASLTAGIAFDTGPPVLGTTTGTHEIGGRDANGDIAAATHTVLTMQATGSTVHSAMLVYPAHASEPPPEVSQSSKDGVAELHLTDRAADRQVVAVHRTSDGLLWLPAQRGGRPTAVTDGTSALFDAHLDGALRSAWADGASLLQYAGTSLSTHGRGDLGLHLQTGRASVLAKTNDRVVDIGGLAFAPRSVDGACGLRRIGRTVRVLLGRERRFTLRAQPGDAAPAADPGPHRAVAVGSVVALDGSASCDADGDRLQPHWELVSSPAASSSTLTNRGSWRPRLHADAKGVYRINLVVTDPHGKSSQKAQVVIRAR
ncbi:MAG: heparinase II/III family protein, partial [Actinomycetota bacterium]|nr:heparinase II/III family protein [Actinomycetota bacterium]